MYQSFCILFILLLFSCTEKNRAIFYIDFEKLDKNTFTSPQGGNIECYSRDALEITRGIAGQSLRFDGNSTFCSCGIPGVGSTVAISLWTAIESFPTHEAGFVSLTGNAEWISIIIDRFGSLGIGTEAGSQYGHVVMDKFSWQHLLLTLNENNATLYLNGDPVITTTINNSIPFKNFLIGKDAKEHFVHLFPTMYINGIIDELQLFNESLSPEKIVSLSRAFEVGQNATLAPKNRFKDDHNRPKYHLLSAANWTNETHGLLFHDGKYHIFNQKNATNVFLGQINWGHFSSTDLIHWTEHIPALTPEKGYDQNGIWSGHVIKDNRGQPVIFYTGSDGEKFGMCAAYPADKNLITWVKDKENPLIYGTPAQYEREDFRDPYLWREGDTWYMIVGYGIDKNDERLHGTLLHYKSKDLRKWESLGTFYDGNPQIDHSGVFWEMPVFWKMDDKYILLVQPIPYHGVPANSIYWTGNFVGERFIPDNPVPKNLEVINRMLSPSVNYDADSNTVAIAIIPDLISGEMQLKQGWTHLYSIPRVWNLVDGIIRQSPHPNLKTLRESPEQQKNLVLLKGESKFLRKGHQLELIIDVDVSESNIFGIRFGKSEKNGEVTSLIFDLKNQILMVDQSKTSQNSLYDRQNEKGKLSIANRSSVKIHVFIDGSVMEGFVDDTHAFSTRFFPKYKSSNEAEVFCGDGKLRIKEIRSWKIKSAIAKQDF